ncbi:Chitin synthase, class 2 [Bulinus truncatus]|nr:Chitin synthase, class 2 [Bulinus truncatus]
MATSPNYADQMNINTLTVDKQWKVEVEIADKLSRQSGPSKLLPVVKWFITILMGSLITCIFVATKLSFISLARFLKAVKPKSKDFDHNEWTHYTGHFLLIYLTLAIPYFLLFLRAAWSGLSTKTVSWPSKTAMCLCVLVGILEPFGLVLLALKVLPNMSPALGAFTMSSFIVFSVIGETIESFRHNSNLIWRLFNVVSIILLFGGVGLTVYMAVESNGVSEQIWHLPVCILVINFVWLPCLQKRLTEHNSAAGTEGVTGTNEGTGHTTTTWKSSLIIYAVKNVSTFLFCFVFFYLDTDEPINFTSEMHSAFLSAWDFKSSIANDQTWVDFGVNLAGGLVGYVLVTVACHTNMQRGCLALPLVLSLPVSVIVMKVYELCKAVLEDATYSFCSADENSVWLIVLVTVIYTLGHTLSIGRKSFKKELVYLQKERELFWIPGYNGAVLDFFLLLNRKQTSHLTVLTNDDRLRSMKTRVYICTTMYREDEGEMKQLLESLSKVNVAQQEGETFFQSHIFFDGGVNNNKLSEFPLVLISLLEETLGIKPEHCTKVNTPYGLKLSWGLPSQRNKERMTFSIHLKDNKLVKNKKRWSQVMYMSYVLDFLKVSAHPSVESYILTTDADVMFTPDSVEALLDLMTRDSSIGAVCARTHPMGSGPLVWYQVFEYAVGHWFQKASEHVLGSVLCAPGCFSVYRCRALSDVLPKYCKKVESAFDFLTKDMGEDRWLCTLMLQSGWRIEYCAASENSTNCPAEFEEFYKQRRRWIASTLANLMLIIKEWKYIALFNHRLTVVFLSYQALLLFSTLIAPSMVILVVSGGLQYAWDINVSSIVILQVILCIIYTLVCLYTSQDTQMLVSKIFTFFYAVVMCAAAVGTAEQVVMDFSDYSTSELSPNGTKGLLFETTTKKPSQHISINLPVSVTTIYLAFLVGIFILGGILHPREFTCLLHGIWYLLCLPSAYLVLILYSICNLTDSSWGTREEIKVTVGFKTNWWSKVYKKFKKIFLLQDYPSMCDEGSKFSGHQNFVDGQFHSEEYLSSIDDVDFDVRFPIVENQILEVDQWLPQELNVIYSDIFKKHGYENTLFIKGLTESDLLQMGVQRKGHVQFILSQISNLPAFEIEYKVPNDVDDWLNEIGLLMYKEKFHKNKIKTLKEMEILKSFNDKTIADQLEIKKRGHIKRLLYAIRMLRDPTEAQKKAFRIRQLLDDLDLQDMKICNIEEFAFGIILSQNV